jgi:hypothetical protein
MLSLFKKHKNNSVLKLFRVVTADEARKFDTKYFINTVLTELQNSFDVTPSDYYITGPYPDNGWKTKQGFLKGLDKNNYQDVCHLLLSSNDYCFSFENWSLNEIQPKPIDNQILIFNIKEEIADLEKLENFAFKLHEVFPFQYGYLLTLPENYIPVTERRKNDSSINKTDIAWTKSISQIRDGVIKDIYPVNLIQEHLVNNPIFKELVIDTRLGTITKTDVGLFKWKLSEQEIRKAKEAFKGNRHVFVDQQTS